MIQAKVLADSKSPQGHRITTFEVVFPRIVLAEFNTHRMFSRNSASSRAIPFKKMVEMVQKNPFIPIAWQKNHKGMQGVEYFENEVQIGNCTLVWNNAKKAALYQADILNKLGTTKQLCNRLLEPFMYHKVIVTATEYENFFKLRCPQYKVNEYLEDSFRSRKDVLEVYPLQSDNTEVEWLQINESQAEIHIQALAEAMWDAYNESTPKELQAGEWHIPFGDNFNQVEIDKFAWKTNKERNLSPIQTEIAIATARCARISYQTYGNDPKIDYTKDIALHDRLLAMEHMSPFEHCAKVMDHDEYNTLVNGKAIEYFSHSAYSDVSFDDDVENEEARGWCRNFRGFIQYRAIVEQNK